MAVSNNFIALLNFLALVCSSAVIGAGIWVATRGDNECFRSFRWPVFILGALLLLVSLAGFVGAYWNRRRLLATYLLVMAALIVVLLVLLVLAFVVTRPDGSYEVPGRVYREYRLQGYSGWLRDRVQESATWRRVRVCLAQSSVCQKLGVEFGTPDQFFAGKLTPLQSGCCKPPTACGYTYANPTVWVNPTNPGADSDCVAWSNDQQQLCYGCNSCKAGLLGNLREEWMKAQTALIISAIALVVVYVVGCSALRNAQTEELFRRYKQGYV